MSDEASARRYESRHLARTAVAAGVVGAMLHFFLALAAFQVLVESTYSLTRPGALSQALPWMVAVSISALVVYPGAVYLLYRALVQGREEEARAQEILLDRNALLSQLARHAADGIILASQDWHFVLANESACRITGYTQAELARMTVMELDARIDAGEYQELWNRMRDAGRLAVEREFRHKEGHTIPVELHSVIIDVRGVPHSLVVMRDLTARKEEAAYRQEQIRLSSLQLSVGLALAKGGDTRQVLTACTEALVDHLGAALARVWSLSRDGQTLELLASSGMYTHIGGESSRIPVGELEIGRIAATREPVLINDVQEDEHISDPDWARRTGMVAFAGYPLLHRGELRGVLGLFSRRPLSAPAFEALLSIASGLSLLLQREVDQRALEATQRQYLQAQKMEAFGLLAGGVAHDFNNLLTVLMGYTDLLKVSLPPEQSEARDIDSMQEVIEKAVGLTRQLLAFSRRQVFAERVFDLGDTLEENRKMLRRLIGEDIELSLDVLDEGLFVKADPSQMSQVVLNLAVNARDAMPEGGVLRLEAYQRTFASEDPELPEGLGAGRYAVICVRDSGTGMDEETLAHIFEPFFTTKEEGRGTGLGLATVFGIVSQSGGGLKVESTLGEGTTFWIFLPRVEPVEAAEEDETRVRDEVPRGRILVVEDDELLRQVLARSLEGAGHQVVVAGGGDEALNRLDLDEGTIDLMITDVVMPDMSGAELARGVRESHPDLPILFMSGYPSGKLSRLDLEVEGDHYLQKPFGPQDLVARVEDILAS